MDETLSEKSSVSYGRGSEDSFVKTVYKHLAHDGEISSSEHITAVDALCKLQGVASRATEVNRQTQIKLICVITSLARRFVRLEDQVARMLYYDDDPDAAIANAAKIEHVRGEIIDFERTATLVFIVIVMLDVVALGGSPVDSEVPYASLDEAMDRSLWEELCKHSKRKIEPPEDLQLNEKMRLLMEDLSDRPFLVSEESHSWSTVLMQPGLLANAAVRASGSLLRSPGIETMDELRSLSKTFAEATSAQMSAQLLKSERDFMTLSSRRVQSLGSTEREQALNSIVSSAESESGQSVLRDIFLSFLLPKKVVGKRRTLLMSRETAAKASKEYPWASALAHEAAMAGAEHLWEHSKSELRRVCALLTGIAMLTTNGTDDTVRKATAFGGLVQLPFLETQPPKRTRPRLALVPTTRSWCLYTLSSNGKPVVEVSQRGIEGLVTAVLLFRDSV
jgi:hypothetical protein